MNKDFYKLKSELIKVMANPVRLMIIDALTSGEKNVSELIALTGENQSNVSKCLSVLKANGIIQDNKKGLNVYYSLKICCMDKFFNSIDTLLKEKLENQNRLLKENLPS
ncbi:MAG: metalloregulator ArsR/SmtB family transcription factor [Fusobacterium sp.]|nr:metalloregulator ArsR/SmtB family transcription factor [Fusobacterium sp.]